jgi:hypothetical protein
MIECVKLLICACVTRYIDREQPFKVRWGFIVNAGLYSVVNLLTHHIHDRTVYLFGLDST